MKKKISISIEEKTDVILESIANEGFFRNKSHVIEYAVNKFLREQQIEQTTSIEQTKQDE